MPDPSQPRLIVLDVDGVLTDGGLYYGPADVEIKRFDIKDGFAIVAAQKAGLHIAILTARQSVAVARRAAELGIEHVIQGSQDKARDVRRIATATGFSLKEAGFMGDDLVDLPAMRQVGYPMTVADAAEEVKQHAALVTDKPGGHGAVREAIEHVLKAQGKWDKIVAQYSGQPHVVAQSPV